ncbi:YrrS family protein [Gracilibacillus lacisalsi]|uniref:YrrS family protein n=1 Tax=Gracilibacillus lacisalsi TaxID=393087 RepID=UPI00037D809D|nr:YrrS family protein [Gracilibacillus lacisalsi]
MADEFGRITRKDRFEKKRTNTKAITWLSIVGGVLVIVIISLIVFGGGDQDAPVANDDEENNDTEEIQGEDPDEHTLAEDQDELEVEEEELEVEENETEEEEKEQNNESVQLNEVESDDENVSYAYEGNWEPIGTEQEEPHTTTFEKETVDWQEMMKAVEVATSIPTDEQVTWWFGRAGDQRVEATVSPRSNQSETYRVTMQWVEEQGWQPLLVEELIENKHNGNSNDNEDGTEEEGTSTE